MLLDEILEKNRAFAGGRAATPFPAEIGAKTVVLACYDPRIDALLLPALGLAEGQAFLLRSAGALARPGGDLLRTLALAALVIDVRDVLVVGHTSCRMAVFDTSSFIEAFRRRGITRDAFGNEDLRAWAGAVRDPRHNVESSVRAIREAAFLPRDLSVAGLMLDDTSGALQVIVAPGEPAPPPVAPQEAPAAEPAKPEAPREPLEALFDLIRSKAGIQEELRRVRAHVAAEPNPVARLLIVEKFLRKACENSGDVALAFESAMRSLEAEGRRPSREAILDLVRRFLHEGKP
jgi:carbonic anhydrase